MSTDSPLAWVAIDFLSCLLLVVYTLVAPPRQPTSVETLGEYAVEVTWPPAREDDLDTYVQDPAGHIVWFGDSDVALMHLDHDDRGQVSDKERSGGKVAVVKGNEERVVLRGALPGEVTANVHVYRKDGPDPVPATIRLYRLRGDDKELLEQHLTFKAEGEEQTAFRFTLDAAGNLEGHNRLSKSLVQAVQGPLR